MAKRGQRKREGERDIPSPSTKKPKTEESTASNEPSPRSVLVNNLDEVQSSTTRTTSTSASTQKPMAKRVLKFSDDSSSTVRKPASPTGAATGPDNKQKDTPVGHSNKPEVEAKKADPNVIPSFDWELRMELIKKECSSNEYLLKHHLGQLEWERERAAPTAEQAKSTATATEVAPRRMEMNAQQRRVAEHPPTIPLAVRAGAGTGKTQTMIQRAIRLVSLYGLDPRKILMVTFTNRAAGEMRERIHAEFAANQYGCCQPQEGLPTVKTFHSLALRWIRTFWRQAGLGRYPNPLFAKKQQKDFMKEIIQTHLKELQLKRCYNILKSGKIACSCPTEEISSSSSSWEHVVTLIKEHCPLVYETAWENTEKIANPKGETSATTENQQTPSEKQSTPKAKAKKVTTPASGRKQKARTPKQLAAEKQKLAERQLQLPRQCYLELLRLYTESEKPVNCDLEQEWSGNTSQIKMYLDLVQAARLGQHEPDEYLPKDAAILKRYERTQELTGQIDFDKMLLLFNRLLERNPTIADQFRQIYDYVIVDEYQDNSEVQSKLLQSIVTNGRVTVVGDDDQCIYGFRGANPGNFKEFAKHYSGSQEHVLEENYRSTGNILTVGAAFLQGSHQRGEKTLRPTKESGTAVEHWKCGDAEQQALKITQSIKRRHDKSGIPWGEVACLFRCFQMGPQAPLHLALQRKLAEAKVPFRMVGGHSFLESEKVMDILAYLSLTLTGGRERIDDVAFSRILNKPTRGIGKKFVEMLEANQSTLNESLRANAIDDQAYVPLGREEAARSLLSNHDVLSDSNRKHLQGFFNLLDELRIAAIQRELPDLLEFIWKTTGLDAYHANKEKSKSKSEKGSGGNGDGNGHVSSMPLDSTVQAFVDLAKSHVMKWKEREDRNQYLASSDREYYFDPNRFKFDHAKKAPTSVPPQLELPQVLLDDLYMPGGVGLPVVGSFLADLALQTKDEENQPGQKDDRVTISTVHRAKGLEWDEVYVPYLNERYMPTNFREDENIFVRHHRECSARASDNNGHCNKNCARSNAKDENRRRGLTPEQLHIDEERRLAHVAATRAKNRLVFLSIKNLFCGTSTFEKYLGELPQSIFESK